MIRVLIADDHPVFREGVRRVLEKAADIQVVGELDSGERLAEAARDAKADVVLVDVEMPGPGHLEIVKSLKALVPRARVLILSGHLEEEHAIPALRAGAAGYIQKNFGAADLTEAVRRVNAGKRWVSTNLADQLAAGLDREEEGAPHLRLSERELEVLTMMASGRSLKEIAADLGINAKTVSSYRARILDKLDVKTNADLVKYALKHDLTRR